MQVFGEKTAIFVQNALIFSCKMPITVISVSNLNCTEMIFFVILHLLKEKDILVDI